MFASQVEWTFFFFAYAFVLLVYVGGATTFSPACFRLLDVGCIGKGEGGGRDCTVCTFGIAYLVDAMIDACIHTL